MKVFYIVLNEKFEDGGANIIIPIKSKDERDVYKKAYKYCKDNSYTIKKIISK